MSCKDCPNRRLGCRNTCASWQAREEEKARRYAETRMKNATYYRAEYVMKKFKVGQI